MEWEGVTHSFSTGVKGMMPPRKGRGLLNSSDCAGGKAAAEVSDILHAHGVRAHQPRATALGKPSRNPNPPCKGGSGFRDLRPCRAQEPSKARFPRVLPWAGLLRAFSAGSVSSRRRARMSKRRLVGVSSWQSVERRLPSTRNGTANGPIGYFNRPPGAFRPFTGTVPSLQTAPSR